MGVYMPTSTRTAAFKGLASFMPVLLAVAIFAVHPPRAPAQTTTFTYQGELTDGGTAANGSYDLQFALFDSAASGTQIGVTQTVPAVSVSNGLFTVQLDFGAAAFPGANRFLEIGVRPGGGDSFTTLTPRQQISSTPYAIRSLNASSADSVAVAGVPAGSSNYIQNANSQQSGTNFNISGDGTAGGTLTGTVVNALTQFGLGGNRVLSVSGTADLPNSNTFAGVGAGAANTPDSSEGSGTLNSFFGFAAGNANTTGESNSFFGNSAGASNTDASFNSFFGTSAGRNNTGAQNSFFGSGAGQHNTTANFNSFFGNNAGSDTTEGGQNSFFGESAGGRNTTGGFNSMFGQDAGLLNMTGGGNAFFGQSAGEHNTTGSNNAFFGSQAGNGIDTGNSNTFIGTLAGGFADTNSSGDKNTLLGSRANVASGVSNSTAIGFAAQVTQSNSLVLGSIKGVGLANANTNVGIGTTSPSNTLVVDVGAGAPVDSGITIRGNTSTLGDLGLRIANTGSGGVEWYVDSTNNNSSYGGSKLAFTPKGQTVPTMILASNGNVSIGETAQQGRLDVAADTGVGVHGSSNTNRAVEGFSGSGIGVIGDSTARGVVGTLGRTSCAGTYAVGGCATTTGDGVLGRINHAAGGGTAAAVHAINDGGGDIFIGEASGQRRARIDGSGKGFFNGGTQSGGADYADSMRTTDNPAHLEPGDVLAIDPQHGDAVRRSREPNSRLVAGVYSTQPSILGVGKHGLDDSLRGEVPVALLGVVPTKVTTENGPIHSGDLLVTSSLPGRAMKAHAAVVNGVLVYPTGAILGKALEPLQRGVGVIKVLVTLR
jgi:hypothetical protein